MEAKAKLRYARVAPRKARLVTDLVKGRKVEEALYILTATPKAASPLVEKLIRSAAANAENQHGSDVDRLVVKLAYVDEGPTSKRWRPRAMGRATPLLKRSSHITVVLAEV